MDTTQKLNFKAFRAVNDTELEKLQKEYYSNRESFFEYMPWAKNGDFVEIAHVVIPDAKGEWSSPIICIISEHATNIGAKELVRKAHDYFKQEQKQILFDILSLSAGMENDTLVLKTLIRIYSDMPNINGLFKALGGNVIKKEVKKTTVTGKVIIPDEIKDFKITPEQQKAHDAEYKRQMDILNSSTDELPFLNRIDHYVPKEIVNPADFTPLTYDLKTKDMSIQTITPYEQFTDVFAKIMTYVSGTEYYHYVQAAHGDESPESFMDFLEVYIKNTFIESGVLAAEDLPTMLQKVYTALFEFYVIQDLIEDPEVTDIKITAYNSIRARIKGKAYLSNISFVDENDYLRFINGICLRNDVPQNIPYIRFSDTSNEDYRLRFTISAAYINLTEVPYLHIRKQPNKKLMAPELMKAGMFDEKLRDYVLDRARHGGIVIGGAPGSGKTYFLNWLFEDAYEDSAEILGIQETDELFAYRKGVTFHHISLYPPRGKAPATFEGLGQHALVAGANVFIIGEAKGAEFCSAITLCNSGCRTALTIHADSSKEITNKMVNLAMKGNYQSTDQVRRELACFKTLVYLENFKIKEITETLGYDDEKKELIQRCVYRR